MSIYLNRLVYVIHVLSCISWILSGIVVTSFGKMEMIKLLFFGLCSVYSQSGIEFPSITKTYLFKYTEKLITEKLKIFRQKNSNIFHISAQNIDCGYSLEPPR